MGENSVGKHHIQPSVWGMSTRFSQSLEMSRLTRDGTAETVSRDKILGRERGQGKVHFPCSAGHVQDGQPYTVVHTLATCVTIHNVGEKPTVILCVCVCIY